MSHISVRGLAVASATAVTAVGAVAGVASSSTGRPGSDAEATAGDTTLLADIPAGQQAHVQTASLTRQADAQAVAADVGARKVAKEWARKQATADAVAKQRARKKAEEKAKERKAVKEAAGRSATRDASSFPVQDSYSVAQIQALASQIVGAGQFQCFSNIVDHESTWNCRALNPSGAYGLVQAYPGSKMSSAGADWRTNPAAQIKWGLNYMNQKYGSPCQAWSYWQFHHSYQRALGEQALRAAVPEGDRHPFGLDGRGTGARRARITVKCPGVSRPFVGGWSGVVPRGRPGVCAGLPRLPLRSSGL